MTNMMGKRPTSGETSTRREPVMSGPKLTANPAEESQSQTGRVGESADISVRTRKPLKQESSAKAPVIFVIPAGQSFHEQLILNRFRWSGTEDSNLYNGVSDRLTCS
jgi:hypothetical protein